MDFVIFYFCILFRTKNRKERHKQVRKFFFLFTRTKPSTVVESTAAVTIDPFFFPKGIEAKRFGVFAASRPVTVR